jgi:hypothetical protein
LPGTWFNLLLETVGHYVPSLQYTAAKEGELLASGSSLIKSAAEDPAQSKQTE